MRLDGDIYTIVEFQHVKPGKGGGFTRTKLKNMDNGRVVERTFRSGDKVEEVRIEKREMQYLYAEAPDQYHFMDSQTYEQTPISKAMIGDATDFLLENEMAFVLVTDDKPIGVELPNFRAVDGCLDGTRG